VDITYYDSGYIDPNYYVYTADAFVVIGEFIVEDYLEPDYFENTSVKITLTCEGTRVRFVEASADLVANFSQSVNGVIDVRAEVTLSTIVSLSSQEIRVREFNSDLSTTVTQSTLASATFSPQVSFSSIASQLTAAFQNATGTISMDVAFTVSAIIGVIREYVPNSNSGLKPVAVSGNYPRIYPDNITGAFSAETISFWIKRDTSSSEGEILYAGAPGAGNNSGFINYDSAGTVYVFDAGFAELVGINWNSALPADTDWHHLFFKYRTDLGGFYGDGYELFVDGVSKGGRTFQSVSAGILSFTGPYGNSIGVGQLHLAQLRIGGAIDLYDVYDGGYIDLGENGRGQFNQLPLPGIFSTLDRPWSNVIINGEYQPQYYSSTAVLPVPDMQVFSRLEVETLTVLVVTVNAESVVTLEVSALKISTVAADLTAVASLDIVNTRQRFASADLEVSSSLAVETLIIRGDSATLTTATSLECANIRVRTSDVTVTAETTFTATIGEITEFNIALESEFTQVAEISRTRNLVSAQESVVTVTAQIDDRLRDQSVSMSSVATLTITYTRIPAISVTLTSEFALSGDAEKLVVAFGTLNVIFTQTSTAFKVVFAQATLVVEAFELTQGDILNFDPCREIAVESETRAAKILPESRLVIVESETRTLKVPQETRVLKVDYETRVNTIKC